MRRWTAHNNGPDRMFETTLSGHEMSVEFWYPDRDRERAIIVGLCDVRAADDIRVSYDFDRDGWVIEQQRFSRGEAKGWAEVSFVKAWGLEEDGQY